MTNISTSKRKRDVESYGKLIENFMHQEESYMFLIDTVMFFMAMMMMFIEGPLGRHSATRKLGNDFHNTRMRVLHRMINEDDTKCVEQLRMDRHTFHTLCGLLRTNGGLSDSRYISLEEMVVWFLGILGSGHSNRNVNFQFMRSGETISRIFHTILHGVIRLQGILYKSPEAVTEICIDRKWKWFKNCLGAIDGTHIGVHVNAHAKARYRNRKGEITTNVLGACSQNMEFTYVLPGWEGSAADARVLRDAVANHGLNVPQGYYYLVDAGYPNSEGFLAPFRGQRYHLSDWKDKDPPQTPKELFNMKHSSARNVIERSFGLLKMRWRIIRDKSFYDAKTQTRIIHACLLHNLIRREMAIDPLERFLDEPEGRPYFQPPTIDPITIIESTPERATWRENLAVDMWERWSEERR